MDIYALPEWRRKGIGRAILCTVLETLGSEGIPVGVSAPVPTGAPVQEGGVPSNERDAPGA